MSKNDNEKLPEIEDFEEVEFIPCSKCDGHPACEDYGCAIKLGLGRMVKNDIAVGYDNWD